MKQSYSRKKNVQGMKFVVKHLTIAIPLGRFFFVFQVLLKNKIDDLLGTTNFADDR